MSAAFEFRLFRALGGLRWPSSAARNAGHYRVFH
jgi:hypothetical protein